MHLTESIAAWSAIEDICWVSNVSIEYAHELEYIILAKSEP
jgi:hypothetical protein